MAEKEMVDHPSHYQSKNGLEAITVIDSFGLDFALGNAVKYILRCGKKDDEIQELRKAIWYIEHEIEIRSGNERDGTEKDNSDPGDTVPEVVAGDYPPLSDEGPEDDIGGIKSVPTVNTNIFKPKRQLHGWAYNLARIMDR